MCKQCASYSQPLAHEDGRTNLQTFTEGRFCVPLRQEMTSIPSSFSMEERIFKLSRRSLNMVQVHVVTVLSACSHVETYRSYLRITPKGVLDMN
eukprot:6213162-Pleurochrysis_carterae.AAC.2